MHIAATYTNTVLTTENTNGCHLTTLQSWKDNIWVVWQLCLWRYLLKVNIGIVAPNSIYVGLCRLFVPYTRLLCICMPYVLDVPNLLCLVCVMCFAHRLSVVASATTRGATLRWHALPAWRHSAPTCRSLELKALHIPATHSCVPVGAQTFCCLRCRSL